MPLTKTRTVDGLQYMKERPGQDHTGEVVIKPCPKHGRILVDVHKTTVYPDENEAFIIFAMLYNAASTQFGEAWAEKARAYVEVVSGNQGQ